MDDLLNVAPCGVLSFNDAGIILHTNVTLTSWLEYENDELEGKSIESILSVASRIFYNTHLFPLVKLHSKADELFFTLVTKGRRDLPVLSNVVRLAKSGKYVNLAVFMPLHQRTKYEEEILEARRVAENALRENRELQILTAELENRTQELEKQRQWAQAITQDIRQFSKIVTHDLQEPIRKIRLFSDILDTLEGHKYSERGRSSLKRIHASAERLVHLTAGLQQYINVDEDRSFSNVDLNMILSSALHKLGKVRPIDQLQIKAQQLPSIEGNFGQLELLFYHVLDNAFKFRKRDSPAKVDIAHTLLDENIYRSVEGKYHFTEHVQIVFSDKGIGFQNEYKHYVFDLVKKIDSGNKDLGIGLALAKKVVLNHSGTIAIESSVGTGTSVTAVLPMKQQVQ